MQNFTDILFNENSSFKLYENSEAYQPMLRMSDDEKLKADSAFKMFRAELLDESLIKYGFRKWGATAYVRLNDAGLTERIELHKKRSGLKQFTVSLDISPVYVLNEHREFCCNNLGKLISGKEFWWDYRDLKTAQNSFTNILDAMHEFGMKFFEHIQVSKNYINWLKKYYPNIEWIVFYYLKYHGRTVALEYLEDYQSNVEKIENEYEKLYKLSDIRKIMDTINSIKYVDEYFRQIAEDNLVLLKLPKAIFKNSKDFNIV